MNPIKSPNYQQHIQVNSNPITVFDRMCIQRAEYSSPLDALVAISKRLSLFENQHSMSSEEFFNCYSEGQLPDAADLIDWANDYRHYLALRAELEEQLRHAA